jgi:hypothetical protein
MRSNINKLKDKYNIQTDKALLNFLADKECMPEVPVIDIKEDKVTKKSIRDKVIKELLKEGYKVEKEFKDSPLEDIDEEKYKEIFSSIQLKI